MSSTLPVLVVGAGPAGLVTALFLAQSGVKCRIVDKSDSYRSGSRGFGVQPRTFELFQMLGMLDDMKKHATPIPPFRGYKLPGGREVAKEWTLYPEREIWPDRPHGNGTCISQETLEDIMRTHLNRYSVFVELSTGLVSFEQDAEKATATLATFENGEATGATEKVECQYIIGADGARGPTRKLLGLTFAGETRDADGQVWGDTEIDGLDNNWWHVWGNPGKWSIIIRPRNPGQGNKFHIGITGQNFDPVNLDRPAAAEEFIAKETGRYDLKFGQWSWISYYKPNMRMVAKFHEGRVFVIGDASHVHSPSGGQGMNTSVYDAANIGWKLALVVKGLASPTLLETFDTERLPVITQMLAATSQLYTHMVSKLKPKELPSQIQQSSDTGDKTGWFKWRNDALEQYGVNYRYSSIVLDERRNVSLDKDDALSHAFSGYEGQETLCAGDRAPDAPGLLLNGTETTVHALLSPAKHTILVFLAATQESHAPRLLQEFGKYSEDVVQTFVITDKGTIKLSGEQVLVDEQDHAHHSYLMSENTSFMVVIRPDGFIGAIVTGAEGIHKYFANALSL